MHASLAVAAGRVGMLPGNTPKVGAGAARHATLALVAQPKAKCIIGTIAIRWHINYSAKGLKELKIGHDRWMAWPSIALKDNDANTTTFNLLDCIPPIVVSCTPPLERGDILQTM